MVDLNTPLAAGDILETGSPGRMEVQLADGSLLWLDDSSRVTFLTLADSGGRYENRTLMGLDSGSLVVLVKEFDPDEKIVRVDTVAATIFFLEPGRIEHDDPGDLGCGFLRAVREFLHLIRNDRKSPTGLTRTRRFY